MEPESITLYGKRDFMNGAKLRILTWGDYPCESQMLSQLSLQEGGRERQEYRQKKVRQ